MEFIVGLPKEGNKSFIMVVVYHHSNHAHFCALPHHFVPAMAPQVVIDQIFKMHGMTTSIVSDCDPKFMNTFCQELFKLHGMQLNMIITYHPQTDDQMEFVNKCLETYFCYFSLDNQHQWVQWLPLEKWW